MPGITETKDVLKFVISIGQALYKAFEDGKFTWGDYIHFLPTIGTLFPALSGIEQVPEELRDLSDEEFTELVEYFKSEFNIPDKIVEEIVELSIDTAANLFEIIKLIKKWKDQE